MDLTWLRLGPADVHVERLQAEQEGRDIGALVGRFEDLGDMSRSGEEVASDAYQRTLGSLLDDVQRAPFRDDYPYDEPSDLESILARRRQGPRLAEGDGRRAAGSAARGVGGPLCGLSPGEAGRGWRRDRMHGYLRDLRSVPPGPVFRRGRAEIAESTTLTRATGLHRERDRHARGR